MSRACDGPLSQRGPPDALGLLEQFGSTVTIRRGQQIYRHGQRADFCWKIVSGCARKVQLMASGRRQISEFKWPGDLLGIDDPDTHYLDAEAVTDVALRRYPRHIVDAQARANPALALRLRTITLANLHSARRHIILLGRKTAPERIASFLLEIEGHSVANIDQVVRLPMNRTDIADHLGLSIETVCRNLVHFQHDGTVLILRSGIELLDRAALVELACG